ncbi:MAG TPA: hypothetical protein VJR23_04860 [Candidatus Acidoferrales bacterium]|nr:hypothetical protein [Candidatus Acidoferrales bacterium]
MENRRSLIALCFALFAVLYLAPVSRAQDNSAEPTGVDSGGYHIQQTVEFGFRSNSLDGNTNTYNTFVNLGTGVRLLDYTLDMRSRDHNGILFDSLHFSNFGYGGDPNNVSRLSMDKNKWYDLRVQFRRDKDFWDYNLFVNPLNPAALNPAGSLTTGCIVSPPSSAHPGLPGFCSNPAIAQTNSPHEMDLVRRMQDYDLTLLPQSRIRFRLGFSHDREQGPGFITGDFGAMPDFPRSYSFTTNAYRAGVDFRILPRTTISYDQLLTYFKQDSSALETPAATPGQYGYQLANGTPVDMGIVWSTQTPAEALPCAAPISSSTTTPPTVNSVCNGFLSYSQVGRPRSYIPTERVRFESNYFKRLEVSGAVGYSTSDNIVPDYLEVMSGYTTRTATRASTTGGPSRSKRVSVNADGSAVFAVTDKFRIEDFFRYDNWRIPSFWATANTNIFGAAASGQTGLALPLSLFTEASPSAPSNFATLCPAAPYNQAGCPLHTSSSGADVTNETVYEFLSQNLKSNTFQLQYDFNRRLTGRIGYLYTNRSIGQMSDTFDTGETYFPGGATASAANDYLAARGDCALSSGVLPSACTVNSDGSITEGTPSNPVGDAANDTARNITAIHENELLLGITARPVDSLKITGDFGFGYNDASFTRIDPRQVQTYKIHVSYNPKPWAMLDGAVEAHENRDNVYQVNNLEHDRMFSFTAMLAPNPRLSVDFGYNYWDVYTQSNICFNFSVTYSNPTPPPNTLPVLTTPPGAPSVPCPIAGASVGAAGLGTLFTYASTDHFPHADVMWKPTKTVTAALGYGGSFVRGSTIYLNPLTPTGTLDYNYQMPYASVTVDIYKGFSYKMAWNYYGFDEAGLTNPFGLAAIPLQNFNANNATFSFRYSF